LQPARQRAALDRFAGTSVDEPLARYRARYQRLRVVEEHLEQITTRARERAQQAALLRFGLGEVEAADPQSGEDVELAAEDARLSHADALRGAAETAHALLSGSGDGADEAVDAVTLVAQARRSVEAASSHDAALAALNERLAELGFLVSDLAGDLASYAASIDTDPLRLAAVAERRAALAALTRKYGPTVDDVLDWAAAAAVQLAELDGDDERLAELTAERADLRSSLAADAELLSAARAAAADEFARAVTAELADLAMPHARVSVGVRRRDDSEGLDIGGRMVAFGPLGVDDVELLLAAHSSAPARPLQKGASGGELSRVMLAVEVVFAGADPVPTFVFDEVDAGVGGRAAVEIGRRLARLAETAQVVVVTHLPQVAAYADQHLLVVKSEDGSVTSSGVVALDADGRVRELSRMLAGLEDSATARAHAEELLETARRRAVP
jgi:DNA repair protein RecN (Recombination protein N)